MSPEPARVTAPASDASPLEWIAFERLLADLAAQFANVAADSIEPAIEQAMRRLLDFLGFDRSTYVAVLDDGGRVVCSVAAAGHARGCSAKRHRQGSAGRVLHLSTPRRARPMIKINCAALPPALIESELFGRVKAPTPARWHASRAASSWRTAPRCSSTRSARCRSSCRRGCCACCRTGASNASAARRRLSVDISMVADNNATCCAKSRPAASARTCTTG